MNNYTAAIGSFIRYDVVVFNTLEYTMKKDTYDINAFKTRKQIIEAGLSENTPLKQCIDNSGEAGKKLGEKINELLKEIYSDDSTIVKLTQDGNELRVDYSQAIKVLELVLPIHEELRKIVMAHVIAAQKEKLLDDESYLPLIEKLEYFYRGLVNMLLLDQFDHQFAEFNKARAEAKGAITPQSNFIQNDINRVVSLFRFVRENATAKNVDYYSVIDPLFALIEMTGGRRDLPAGKNFGTVFTEVKTLARTMLQKWEAEWNAAYSKFLTDYSKGIAEFQKEIEAKQAKKEEGKA